MSGQSWLAAAETMWLAELKLSIYYLALPRKSWLSLALETWSRIPRTPTALGAVCAGCKSGNRDSPRTILVPLPPQVPSPPLWPSSCPPTSVLVAELLLWPWKALSLRE